MCGSINLERDGEPASEGVWVSGYVIFGINMGRSCKTGVFWGSILAMV